MSIYEHMLLMISEGAAQVKKQFVDTGKIDYPIFKELKAQDPTQQNKYLLWMVKSYIEDNSRSPGRLGELVKGYDILLENNQLSAEKKDIYKLSYDEIETIVNENKSYFQKKESEKEGLELVVEGDKVGIYLVRSFEALKKKAGGRSDWCISKNIENWVNYLARGSTFYFVDAFVIDKWYMIEVTSDGKQKVWNEHNNVISYEQMLKEIGITEDEF